MSFPEYTPTIPTPQDPAHQLPYRPQQAYAQRPTTNVLAIISLISAFVFSAAAIVTGHIALSQIKRTGETGRGLAFAGLIIGYIGVVVTVIASIIWFAVMISLMSHAPMMHNPGYGYDS
jgi:hypothetical protein